MSGKTKVTLMAAGLVAVAVIIKKIEKHHLTDITSPDGPSKDPEFVELPDEHAEWLGADGAM